MIQTAWTVVFGFENTDQAVFFVSLVLVYLGRRALRPPIFNTSPFIRPRRETMSGPRR